MNLTWKTLNGGVYESIAQVIADRAPNVTFGFLYVAFCKDCRQELRHVVTIPVTGAGPTEKDVFECGDCQRHGELDESWMLIRHYTNQGPWKEPKEQQA